MNKHLSTEVDWTNGIMYRQKLEQSIHNIYHELQTQ